MGIFANYQNYILNLADEISNISIEMSIVEFLSSGLFLLITGGIMFFGFMYASVVSIYENEKSAAGKFFLLGILLASPFILFFLLNFEGREVISYILIAIIGIFVMVFLIPIRFYSKYKDAIPQGKIDERDTMFSRNELKKDTEKYQKYYNKYPEKQLIDDNIKSNPGLLNTKATSHHPAMFFSSKASFFAVDALKQKVDGDIAETQYAFAEKDITNYIKKWAKKLGAMEVGVTELRDYHSYSYRGRKGNYNKEVTLNNKFAIAFSVEMDFDNVRSGPLAPIVMESAQQYMESGAIAVQLAEFIRSLGYPARAHIDGNYEVVCPLVAKDAGLGEIGRMGLLMTPKHGPRVRLGVVTTDLPLVIDENGYDPSVIEFCTNCKKCAVNCPSDSISMLDRVEIDGVIRWQINQESCFDFWTKSGTDCGRCMSVCPYSHPDNLLHNIVRFGIKNSSIFSRIALNLDDFIYGKKPPVKQPVDWMNIKVKE